MRPTRLELAGFGSWLDPTIIDFEGADLFALTGDTGAGKSTILDAISFALYGNAPRHGKKDVEPLINRSANEARVRLDFLLDGQPLTVTRVLKRMPNGGASTKEARFERLVVTADGERDTETIIAGAKDVTGEVERRIGLTWEHFTTAVILPQGKFQEFLLATSSERQDLLNELLRLGVFEAVKQAAGLRAKQHGADATAASTQLEGLGAVSPDMITAAEQRLTVLDELLARREEVRDALDELREEARIAKDERDRIDAQATALRAIRTPDALDDLAARLTDARAQRKEAGTDLAAAEGAHAKAAAQRAELPDTAAVRGLLETVDDLDERAKQLAGATKDVTKAEKAATKADDALAAARADVDRARAALDEAARHDHAAAAAAGLDAGDPCPVCGRGLEDVPSVATADLEAARQGLANAEQVAAERDQAVREADSTRSAAAANLATLTRQEQELRERVGARTRELGLADARSDIMAALDRATAADATLAEAEKTLDGARRTDQGAAKAEDAAQRAMRQLDEQLRDTRATIGALDLAPPAVDSDDLAAGWRTLVVWAAEQLPTIDAAAEKAATRLGELTERGTTMKSDFLDRAAAADVQIAADSRTFDEVATARAQHDAQLARLRADLERATNLREQVRDHEDRRRLAEALAETLKANKLERWLLGRVLKQLVAGASGAFHDLSGGNYSLRLAEGTTIEVVDHANADLARSVQSLSGGETFLASLSLALALADEVASLATDGAARLDALFIDEGFGTLDAETLDTVAVALQALGEKGRMIGVVTHVRDLADQMPLRFEIARVGPASRVRRSDAGDAA